LLYMRDPRLRKNLHAQLLSQIEVIVVEAVLRTLGAAGDTATAQVAAATGRPLSIQKGVVGKTMWITKIDTLRHRAKCMRRAHTLRGGFQPLILNAAIGIHRHAEYAFGRGVMRRQFGRPIGTQRTPGWIAI